MVRELKVLLKLMELIRDLGKFYASELSYLRETAKLWG